MELSAAAEALFGRRGFVSRGLLDDNLPHAVSVAAFRLRTGHYYLTTHLHRINVLPSPECHLCSYGTMNSEYLRACSALDHSKKYQDSIFKEVHLYWTARHLMAQQPRVGVVGGRRRRNGTALVSRPHLTFTHGLINDNIK
ncbi:hypothetical protein TNCT_445581 [Trichonephila clavata]|uniref:Uncharacterized protein n=1 Tax=Trichonephila clavata TaxID=2740835 RepID=A0A8X6G373_TRICU|nr:hypothetical protein TNCT_445581 [Trichonephila clavata]